MAGRFAWARVADLVSRFRPGAETILNLGCGTGSHDFQLAKNGFRLVGIDRSARSIEKAKAKLVADGDTDRIRFEQAGIESLSLAERFDAVISLFHVMSYMTTEDDLLAAFAAAYDHLGPGGVFVFDCWYGPAVLTDPPAVRVKRIQDGGLWLIRVAEPDFKPDENLVDVHYQVLVGSDKCCTVKKIRECHRMRYWFKPEVERLLAQTGFIPADCLGWMSKRSPGTRSWSACFIARKP